VKEALEGWGPTEHKGDLARSHHKLILIRRAINYFYNFYIFMHMVEVRQPIGGQFFYVGWMRSALVYENSFPMCIFLTK
jgi:hypothetical protein